MPRGAKHKRSQDEARLAEEKARPKPPKRRPASASEPIRRPELRATRKKTVAKAPKAPPAKKKRARTAKSTAKRKPRAPRTKPELSLKEEVFGTGPPKREPELDAGPMDTEGRPLSQLWDLARANYRPTVRTFVDELMRRNRIELDDLIFMEFAEHAELAAYLATPGIDSKRIREALASTMLQSRKQMARLLVARGPIGGVNDVPVRVPDGLDLESLTRTPDEGDDVLAKPRDADLPQQYRA